MNIPIIQIPSAEYHAESRNGRYLSSHLLADFRESPELYHRKTTGEIASVETPALALGRAAHCLILEGRAAFDEQFIVSDGPVNARTSEPYGKATKAYAEWLASQDREVVSARDYGFITKLQKSVWLHDAAAELLDDGSPEGVIRTEYCGVPCQIRMDWFSPEHGIADLKTCDSLKWFEGDCRRFGYAFQMAFYRAVLREATGETAPSTWSPWRRTSRSARACRSFPATMQARAWSWQRAIDEGRCANGKEPADALGIDCY